MRFLAIVAAAGLVAGSAYGVLTRPAASQRPLPVPAPVRPDLDIGTDETLLLVVAGEFPTRAKADEANARIRIGDVHGFVVAPSGDFAGLRPGRFLVVSAFRTLRGATEFEEIVRVTGNGPTRRLRAVYRGSAWIGLGQEAHPDGSGPLLGPLEPNHPDRL